MNDFFKYFTQLRINKVEEKLAGITAKIDYRKSVFAGSKEHFVSDRVELEDWLQQQAELESKRNSLLTLINTKPTNKDEKV